MADYSLAAGKQESADFKQAYESINPKDLSRHIKVLADDAFGGRAPASAGETKTLSYLEQQFKSFGFVGGNAKSFRQQVPLVEVTAANNIKLTIDSQPLVYKQDYVAVSRHLKNSLQIKQSDLVFVGYGIHAPEYGWNDYAGIDVKGKTVVVLVNDPGFATKDKTLFEGDTMTYYGRWTYKYEEASRQGAAAVMIVHEDKPASYGWPVVSGGWSGPQFDLKRKDGQGSRVTVEGWFHLDATKNIFKKAGLDFETQKKAAMKKGFKPVPLKQKFSITLENSFKETLTNNFIATLRGRTKPDEHIIYMGHWDHLGTKDDFLKDKIYNGAHDNATGVAGLIEIGQAFSKLKTRPERSITIIAMAAEEQGLIGSEYYAQNPIYPLNKTLAAINMDSLNIVGRMKDITVVGYGKSELEDYLKRAAKIQNRYVKGEAYPQGGGFYRSDHFRLAKKGVPALYASGGTDILNPSEKAKIEKRRQKIRQCYHQSCDEFDPTWDFQAATDDVRLFFHVGYDLTKATSFPNWNKTAEFRKIRDKSMSGGS
ncbi:MAG: M28 family peptidase [Pseudobacteriovorax sp.]|nr:M28 family peptidase [Pseudobacteriovorax sp.]